MKIGLDFDGVISDCGKLKSDGAKRLYGVDIPPAKFKKEIVVGEKHLTAEQYRELQTIIYGTREIGFLMEPVDGVLHYLPRLVADGHTVLILHRDLVGIPKLTRLVKRADGYYVQIVCETETIKAKKTNKQVGLDLGLKYFVADSDGNKVEAPKFFRKAQYKLARNQRQLSKKQKSGKNRNKARQIVAKNHLKIQRQRKDWLHKISYKYANENDVVVVENLNVSGMVKNYHLALSISDVSWQTFVNMLEYKLQTLSRVLVKVNPAYTSQICSQCGAIVKKSLSQRTHYCPECLFTDCRDVNAAKNIKKLGTVRSFGEDTAIADLTTQEAIGSLAR